jgi:hypothetical protein
MENNLCDSVLRNSSKRFFSPGSPSRQRLVSNFFCFCLLQKVYHSMRNFTLITNITFKILNYEAGTVKTVPRCPALMLKPTRVAYKQVSQELISLFRVLAPPSERLEGVRTRSTRCSIGVSISAVQF